MKVSNEELKRIIAEEIAKVLEEEGDKVTMHGCEFAKGLSKDAFGNAGRKCKPGMGKTMWLTKYEKYLHKSKGG